MARRPIRVSLNEHWSQPMPYFNIVWSMGCPLEDKGLPERLVQSVELTTDPTCSPINKTPAGLRRRFLTPLALVYYLYFRSALPARSVWEARLCFGIPVDTACNMCFARDLNDYVSNWGELEACLSALALGEAGFYRKQLQMTAKPILSCLWD